MGTLSINKFDAYLCELEALKKALRLQDLSNVIDKKAGGIGKAVYP